MNLVPLIFFVFGTIIGSFLNVVVLRYGSLRLSSARSLCFSCGKMLHWYELIPVFSFFVQRGRCRGCKSAISLQYPLVELLTGLVFVAVLSKHSFLLSSSYSVIQLLVIGSELLLWSLLISLSVYDIKHKIIPNALVYTAALVSLLILFLTFNFSLSTFNSPDLWSGPLFAAPFALLWFFSKGRAIGFGDAKLIVFFPWFLGLAKGLSALIIGFWIGAGVSLGLLFLKASTSSLPKHLCPTFRAKLRHLSMKTELPLGPFLVLGLFLVYVFGWDVTSLSLLLQ
ncbi:MAG: prepilin peptidase [bacterium]|nr:prepilin peptidase [bacterium]